MSLSSSQQFHVHSISDPHSTSTVQQNGPYSGRVDANPPGSTEKKKSETSAPSINNGNPDRSPPSSRVQSPKTRHEPRTNHMMTGHHVLESLLLPPSSQPLLPPSLPLPSSKMPLKKKRTATEEGGPTHQNKSSSNSSTKKQHHKKHNNQQSQNFSSPASLVVCGVDGTVFTLDAFSGQLRGMFASGPALVFSSDTASDHRVDGGASDDPSSRQDQEYGYDGEGASTHSSIMPSSRPHTWKERVVPGLDGALYSLYEQSSHDEYIEEEEDQFSQCRQGDMAENDDFLDEVCNSQAGSHDDNNIDDTNIMPRMDRYKLQLLPISVMDVVDSPISTCRPVADSSGVADEGQQRRQCGIVVGSKKTTIYAIDPMTGKVRWTQDPHGGGGAKGFTTSRPADPRGKPTVLLQREDYVVRHLDTDGGGEVWKVEVGRFSALDFDVDSHHQSNSHSGSHTDDTTEDSVVVGGRRRGAAATAAAIGMKDKHRSDLPPILSGPRKKFSSHKDDPEFESEHLNYHDTFNHEHSNFRAFPSIAFGEDGTSILAVDSISGELLWKRQIESVVAAVYGVGKASTWVPLDVIEESEVFTYGQSQSASLLSSSVSPSTSHSGGGLVPYGVNQIESDQLHRLGRHQEHLFVSSKFDSVGLIPPPFPEQTNVVDDAPDNTNQFGHYEDIYAPKQAPLFSHVPYPVPDHINPPVSHRTEHGLYLTWSMVSAILAMVFSLLVFARVSYLHQKKKWENTPTLAPATAPNSYEDGGGSDQSLSPRMNLLPPAAASTNQSRVSFPGTSWWKLSTDDKITQPPARSLSLGAIGRQVDPAVTYFMSKETDSHMALAPRSNAMPLFGSSKAEVQSFTGITTVAQTITRSMTAPDDDQPKEPGIDNIDGIPLVRYSRYRSEFKELSALGRGGFGTVFRCENALDSREYAIKKIWIKSQLLNGKVTEQFSQKLHRVLREVKILALLDHPNIVRYYTAWLEVDNDTTFDDDDSNPTNSKISPSLFSGFGSTSRGASSLCKTKGSLFSKSKKGISSYMPKSNPLGWNNFGSFPVDESKSTGKLANVDENIASYADASREDDLGFVWERSLGASTEQLSNVKQLLYRPENNPTLNEGYDVLSSRLSSVTCKKDAEANSYESNAESFNQSKKNSTAKQAIRFKTDKNAREFFTTEGSHVLYIQMQLCSVRTLADFLRDRRARSGNGAEDPDDMECYAVDIPFALRLFGQIVHGVKYVHKQGLIHRDLKPQNCFIDEAGNVKVGDFGLSRESSSVGSISAFDDSDEEKNATDSTALDPPKVLHNAFRGDAENTAGVGTQAYASPEQMRGSNYDASTDIYSLGIILFEMCYPLYTAHERYKEFSEIRGGRFPAYWESHVKKLFPSLHDILVRMISPSPSKRPTAADVSEHIDKLLGEYSVQSLDKAWGKKGAILLRVETDEAEGVLAGAMKLIKTAAPQSIILQYGLRGQASKAIMEFAIDITSNKKDSLERISSSLRNRGMLVRQISYH
ncbi:hypothetical protein HJC23_002047 [Cyclotella cryptica]|uniref:non-specific serine/threonine protein kinase n=1 Tax=Cyclotella cryptica TaxID=29204 RepID=A0ABD3Q688_9STRA|eukprot:CCRYP_008277-RA/>CCRYP_008277-RA protein AED:0.03 eAED:0.03 QI:406/1/1/1/1/1/5/396/1496